VGITFVYVTHDQEEALTMSERIGVMREGKLLQVGIPEEIYESPVNRFVADFIGETNFIEGEVVEPGRVRLISGDVVRARTHSSPGSLVTLTLRPEKLRMVSSDSAIPAHRNVLKGVVERRVYFGDTLYYEVRVGEALIDVRVENRPGLARWETGDSVMLDFRVEVSPELEAEAERERARRGLFTALPSYVYLVFFFAIPLVTVFVFSFASRSRTGRPILADWNLESWTRLLDPLVAGIAWRSLWLAVVNTALCLVIGYPFAYWIATRRRATIRSILLVLVLIPFWSNFLVRTYAWRTLLDSNGLVTQIGQATGLWDQMLFTIPAVFIGLLYGYLPFMVLPLYAAIAKTTLLGNYIVTQFGAARNWPFGASLSGAILIVMLAATVYYFRSGARTL
jgi:ABC-type spermidine/putrescine transport system permease subunit I